MTIDDNVISFSSSGTQQRCEERITYGQGRRGATKSDVDLQVDPARTRNQTPDAADRAGARRIAEANRRERTEDVRDQETINREPSRGVLQVDTPIFDTHPLK